mmetsp:Transcript_128658/g.400319  ORF Transcript_128658/g.400319 Transcript_128658/m.400319 type:complete len:232 (-) Transcript_128658:182-877(-)
MILWRLSSEFLENSHVMGCVGLLGSAAPCSAPMAWLQLSTESKRAKATGLGPFTSLARTKPGIWRKMELSSCSVMLCGRQPTNMVSQGCEPSPVGLVPAEDWYCGWYDGGGGCDGLYGDTSSEPIPILAAPPPWSRSFLANSACSWKPGQLGNVTPMAIVFSEASAYSGVKNFAQAMPGLPSRGAQNFMRSKPWHWFAKRMCSSCSKTPSCRPPRKSVLERPPGIDVGALP